MGTAPILFGSKSMAVQFGEPDYDSMGGKHFSLHKPTCHLVMKDLHMDMLSIAAEIYAALVGLNETLHLAYISGKLGFDFLSPILLEVDNASTVAL